MHSIAPPSHAVRRSAAPGMAAAVAVAAAGLLALAGGASRAQDGAIRLDVAMGHHALAWQGEPNAAYTVRLSNPNAIDDRNPDGEKAFVTDYADDSGAVQALLHFRTNHSYYRIVEPGDRLEVAIVDGPTRRAWLPYRSRSGPMWKTISSSAKPFRGAES